MSTVAFVRQLARQLPAVTYSRALRGPARKSWSFRYELFAAVMRGLQYEFGQRPWAELRVKMEQLSGTYAPTVKRLDRRRGELGGIDVTWFEPRFATDVTVLYTHGGGYVFGSVSTHQELIARLALAAPARIVAPEYRLAPEHPFPAAIDDIVSVYRALIASGQNPARLVVAGDSAGGGLTMALLQRLKASGDRMPAGAVLICPWADLTASGGSLETNAAFDWGSESVGEKWKAAYLNGHDASDPLASAVYADLAGLPPMLIQVGEAEIIFDQSVALAKRAREAGVDARLAITTDQIHDWHTFAAIFPDCAQPIDEIGSFIREATRT